MSSAFIFVGERQSPKAHETGATWESGRLAAKPLHEALRAAGVDPSSQRYVNLWKAPGLRHPGTSPDASAVAFLRRSLKREGATEVIALGKIVSRELAKAGIPHRTMTHPAARGSIRRRDRYIEHVRTVLGSSDLRDTPVPAPVGRE